MATWTPIPYWMDGAADVAETTYTPFQTKHGSADGETLELEADPANATSDMPSGRFAANGAWLAVQGPL